ncbi:hypothetical protein ACLMJK_001296 [Lecanora helva]
MRTAVFNIIWVFALTTPISSLHIDAALVRRAPDVASSVPTITSNTLGTAIGGALDPYATRPPTVHQGRLKFAETSPPDLKINVVNAIGIPLAISYASNAGGPKPDGDPGPGTLTLSTQISCPSGWAGRITIGKNYDPLGSKIEASFVPPNFVPDVDVSYVDGYTVPITCSCSGVPVTGCNVPLFHDGHACDDEGPGPICYNPQVNVPHGPPLPFFAPCQGSAYTFPYDDGANSYDQCQSGVIDCCVGRECPAPARQP